MYQKLIVLGNLGKDPEMRYVASGDQVTQFSVAVNKAYTKGGEKVKETVWFRVSVWGKQAEACNQYLKKGSQVLVEGELVADKETGNPHIFNRNDGTSGASFEVRAHNVKFINTSSDAPNDDVSDENIPF